MDGRRLGARGHDDEISVPGLELLEQREQLLALGAALRAPHALLRFPPGQLEGLDLQLRRLPRLHPPLGDAGQEDFGAVGGLEPRIGVDGPGDVDQRLPPPGRSGIEELQRAPQTPARDPRERRQLLLAELGRVLANRLPHRGLREAPERNELAAGANRLGQRPQPLGDEDDDGVRRRLLEILEERVRSVLVQRVGAEDEVDAPLSLERPHVEIAAQLPDVVDPDLLAERLEEIEIGMAAALDARVVAEQLRREAPRELALADAGRTVEEIGVRRPFLQRGREQPLGLVLLRNGFEAAHVPPSRSRPALRAASIVPRFSLQTAPRARGRRRRPSPEAPSPSRSSRSVST